MAILQNTFSVGNIFQNMTFITKEDKVHNEIVYYNVSCNNCGNVRQISSGSKYTTVYCRNCKQLLFKLTEEKIPVPHIGEIHGNFTIVDKIGRNYVGECKNGTKYSKKALSNFKDCRCKLCKPNKGFQHKAGATQYQKILLEGHDGTLETYEDFTKILHLKTEYSKVMIKINNNLPWGAENIKFVRGVNCHDPELKYREIVSIISNHHEFVRLHKNMVVLKCKSCDTEIYSNKSRLVNAKISGNKLNPHMCVKPDKSKLEKLAEQATIRLDTAIENLIRLIEGKYTLENYPKRRKDIFSLTCNKCNQLEKLNLSSYKDYIKKHNCYKKYGSKQDRFYNNQNKVDLKYGEDKLTLLEFSGVDNQVKVSCNICKHIKTFPDMYRALNNKYSCHCQAKYSLDPNEPCKMYYVKVVSEEFGTFYKIGITTQSVKSRFRRASETITSLKVWKYTTVTEALQKESEILEEFSRYRTDGKTVLSGNGGTECFTKDVLGLDTQIKISYNKPSTT